MYTCVYYDHLTSIKVQLIIKISFYVKIYLKGIVAFVKNDGPLKDFSKMNSKYLNNFNR